MSLSDQAQQLVPPSGWLDAERDEPGSVNPGFILVMVLTAAALRLWELTGPSLWVDEMLTWQTVRPDADLDFVEQILDSIQGPLYMAVIWPLVRIQESALMMRLPSAVAGILTVPVFAVLAGRYFPRRTARIAVLLLVLNPFHIWYSQEGRGYAFLILFAVLTGLFFLETQRLGPSRSRSAGLVLAAAAMILSNLTGLFLWLGMGLGLLLLAPPRNARQWGWWIGIFAASLVLVAPWLLKASGIWAVDRVMPGAGTGSALRGETTFNPMALPFTLFSFFYGYSLGPSLRELHQPDRMALLKSALPVLGWAALPVAVAGAAALRKFSRLKGALLVWILVPALILVLLAVRNVKPWNPRYLATALPWILMLTACGLVRLPRWTGLATSVVLTLMTVWSLSAYFEDERYAKADVRAAARVIAERNHDGVPVLVPTVTSVFNFYYDGQGKVLDTFGRPPLRQAAEADALCRDLVGDSTTLWVVVAREWFLDPDDRLLPAMDRLGSLSLEAEPAGVRVYRWVRDRSGQGGS